MPRTQTKSASAHVVAFLHSVTVLTRSLEQLARAIQGLATDSRPAELESRRPRHLKLTAKRRAALKLQGRYIGYMRTLKPRQKAEVRALREKRGIEAAIKKASQMSGKRKAA